MFARMGTYIGKAICVDRQTKTCKRLDYAWVQVLVDADTKYPEYVNLKSSTGRLHKISIEYKWKPRACSVCKHFGHDDGLCEEPRQSDEEDEITETPTPSVQQKDAPPVNMRLSKKSAATCNCSGEYSLITAVYNYHLRGGRRQWEVT